MEKCAKQISRDLPFGIDSTSATTERMLLSRVLLPLLLTAGLALSLSLPGQLNLTRELTSKDVQNTRIELQHLATGSKRTTHLYEDGSFAFNNLPQGEYVLFISSIDLNLLPFKARVEVADDVTAYVLRATSNWATKGIQIPLPLQVVANPSAPERTYLKERTPSILKSGPVATVLNSPIYLGGAVLGILAVVAPYLMEKFDPETAKEMRQQRQSRAAKPSKAALEAAMKLQKIGKNDEGSGIQPQSLLDKSQQQKKLKKRKN